ncbi:MAG TPA: hypothetical protein IGS37_05485 [Synechococcales cyanobacterium M55_K2018_004]|nr:hypothetical protein [Synechococcales cyanobacterium M55_K2018_004]
MDSSVTVPRLSEGVEDWVRCRLSRSQPKLQQWLADRRLTSESYAAAMCHLQGVGWNGGDRTGGYRKSPVAP